MDFPPADLCTCCGVLCADRQMLLKTGINTKGLDRFTHAATVLGQVEWSLLLFMFVASDRAVQLGWTSLAAGLIYPVIPISFN